MDLGMSNKVKPLVEKVRAMVRNEIMPLEEEYEAEIGKGGDRWAHTKRQEEILESLKAKARERGGNFKVSADRHRSGGPVRPDHGRHFRAALAQLQRHHPRAFRHHRVRAGQAWSWHRGAR